jgi:hypothetical protein
VGKAIVKRGTTRLEVRVDRSSVCVGGKCELEWQELEQSRPTLCWKVWRLKRKRCWGGGAAGARALHNLCLEVGVSVVLLGVGGR